MNYLDYELSFLNLWFIEFATLVEHGKFKNEDCYLIMENCGSNIERLKFDSHCVAGHNEIISAAQTVLKALEKIHKLGYVHCDIKPYNIMYEKDKDGVSKYKLIDFGISTKYVDENGKHFPRIKRDKFRGSIDFTSTDCLKRYFPTRKSDLESLVLTILYLFHGRSVFQSETSTIESGDRILDQLKQRIKINREA